MTRDNTPDRYPDSFEEGLITGVSDVSSRTANNRERLEIYDRKAGKDWQGASGEKRQRIREEEATGINISSPYPSDSGALSFDQTTRHSRISPDKALLALFSSQDKRSDAPQSRSEEEPTRVPIREAMNAIRSIIAHVRADHRITQDDISALNAAYDLLGVAAAECRIAHNLGELKFINHVRSLLGSGLGRDEPLVSQPLPRVELTDSGALAQGNRLAPTRSDFDGAGALVGQVGLPGSPLVDAPRVDTDTAGAVSHASDQTLKREPGHHLETPRVASVEETGRIETASLESEGTRTPGRFRTLEQIGILISQRERSGKSMT